MHICEYKPRELTTRAKTNFHDTHFLSDLALFSNVFCLPLQ